MKLLDNWQRVLARAWSMRLMALAAVLSGVEAALPFAQGWLPVPPGIFALLSLVVSTGAFVARIVVQQSVSGVVE